MHEEATRILANIKGKGKMPRQAIRNEGEPAEQEFFRLVAGARKSPSARLGDAVVAVDGRESYVEVKCVTSNTINQIRAVKLIPLAIYSPEEPLPWAVLSGVDVVRQVFEKDRGQHSELALECANLTRSSLPQNLRCGDDTLNDRVVEAIRRDRRYPELVRVLKSLLDDLAEMKTKYRGLVSDALNDGDRRD